MRRPAPLLTIALLVLAAALRQGSGRAALGAEAPRVAVEAVSGDLAGELVRIEGGALSVRTEGAEPVAVPVDGISTIAFGDGKAVRLQEAPAAGVLALLPGGDRIAGEITGSGEGWISVRSQAFGEVRLPMAELAGLVWKSAKEKDASAIVAESAAAEVTLKDRLYLPNGDMLEGLVGGVSASVVSFDGAFGPAEYETGKLAGCVFGAASRRAKASAGGLHALIETSTGERLRAKLLGWQPGGSLKAETLFGSALEANIACFARMAVRGGRAQALAELEPARVESRGLYEGEPAVWPAIRRGSSGWLVLRPACAITYDLGGRYAEFRAEAAVASRDGVVSLRIITDGREVFSADAVKAGGEPTRVAVKLAGASRMTVSCGFGPDPDDAGDHLELRKAYLVRAEEKR